MFTLNCRERLVTLDRPLVMGIINITPDSFYEGYLNAGADAIVTKAKQMIAEGATFLDIGGQSTRPGSNRLSATEEAERVLPIIPLLKAELPEAILSIDTYHAAVAQEAVKAGAAIVNDISGGKLDDKMLPTVAALQVPYVCMHMQGTPETMQQNPHYDNVLTDVLDYFIERVTACRKAGIKDIIVDPGFGFGKTQAHNFTLLKNLSAFAMLQCPILAGMSRKGMVYRTLGITPDEALNGSTVLHTLALHNGAHILRVHDVKEAMEVVRLWEQYNS